MGDKKAVNRYTVRFNPNDPLHVLAMEILDRQCYHGKAQFIASAVQHYADWLKAKDNINVAQLDEKAIEAVVSRILRDRADSATNTFTSSEQTERADDDANYDEEVNFDEALAALGEDGFNAIADALEMFRSI